MKKVILFLSVFILGLSVMSCDDDDPATPDREIQLDKTAVALFLGTNGEVTISQGATNNDPNVEYSAVADNDNVTVAVMGNKVTITASKIGTAKVTVTDVETKKTAVVDVTVKALPEVSLDPKKVEMFVGDNSVVTISQKVNIAKDAPTYTATANNSNVTVKVEGNKLTITGAKVGTAKVTVLNTRTKKTAVVDVTVKALPEITVSADNVDIIETQVKEVEIKTGSGNYTVKSSSDNNLTAKVENNKVILTGVKCDEAGLRSTEVKVTITDAKGKTKEINVNVYQKVDIAKNQLELNKGDIEGVGISSGYFKVIKATSSDENIATVKVNVAENGLKQIEVTAVAAGQCSITVTDGVATKTIAVTVKEVAPVTIWGPNSNSEFVVLKEFTLKGEEQYFTLKGGTGKFNVIFDKDKLTSKGLTDNYDGTFLLHIGRNPKFADGTTTIRVEQKGNPNNFAELKINILGPIKFTYSMGDKAIKAGHDADGDDLLNVKLDDIVTLKVTGQTGNYYLAGGTRDGLEFIGLVEKELPLYGKKNTVENGTVKVKMIKKGKYYFFIKDYKTYEKKWVTFNIE